jgi:hypothetical protein
MKSICRKNSKLSYYQWTIQGRRAQALEPEGDSNTLLRVNWKLVTGTPALLERLVAGKIQSAVSDAFYQLRELLETGSVTLDNGNNLTNPQVKNGETLSKSSVVVFAILK